MKLTLVAIGQRPPAWASAAFDEFAKRFPPELGLDLKALKAEPRTTGKTTQAMMAAEAVRIEAALPAKARAASCSTSAASGAARRSWPSDCASGSATGATWR